MNENPYYVVESRSLFNYFDGYRLFRWNTSKRGEGASTTEIMLLSAEENDKVQVEKDAQMIVDCLNLHFPLFAALIRTKDSINAGYGKPQRDSIILEAEKLIQKAKKVNA